MVAVLNTFVALKKTDKRLLEGFLGGMGFIAATFAQKPDVSIPVAFTSVVVSTSAIILDTWEPAIPTGDNPPRLPFDPKSDTLTLNPTESTKTEEKPILKFNF